jgi:hypothetical protein
MEGSLIPKRLNGIANQHNPTHRRSRCAGEGGASLLSQGLHPLHGGLHGRTWLAGFNRRGREA